MNAYKKLKKISQEYIRYNEQKIDSSTDEKERMKRLNRIAAIDQCMDRLKELG